MYTVHLDGMLLLDVRVPGLNLVLPKLEHEINKAGTFTFTILPTHPYIGRISALKPIITIEDESGIIWRGRVLNMPSGFKNDITCTCEGEMAFLNDSSVREYDYAGDLAGYFTFLINQHNEQVDDDKRFIVGNITVEDPNDYVHFSSTQLPKTLAELNEKLLKKYGGYIWFRHESDGVYVDYLTDSNLLCNQKIVFGKNLIDLKRSVKGQDVATVIIPRGAKIEDESGRETDARVTIESVNDGKDYVVNEEAAALFGKISRVVYFDDVTQPENLLRKAQEYAADLGNLIVSYIFTAADLHKKGDTINNYRLFRYVEVVSPPHGIDDNYLIRKININLTNPLDGKLTVGTTFKTLTDKTVEYNGKYGQIVEKIYKVENNLKINQGAVEEIKGNSVYKTEVLYAVSESDTESPAGPWTPSYNWQPGQYVWQKIVTTKGNGTVKESEPVCITGAQGPAGKDGEDAIWTYIESVNGFVFGSNIATTVTARICKGQEEIDPGGEFDYTWYGKTDGDWEIIGAGKSMTLNSAEERMQLYFEADGDGGRYSLTDHEGNYLTDNYGNRLVV